MFPSSCLPRSHLKNESSKYPQIQNPAAPRALLYQVPVEQAQIAAAHSAPTTNLKKNHHLEISNQSSINHHRDQFVNLRLAGFRFARGRIETPL